MKLLVSGTLMAIVAATLLFIPGDAAEAHGRRGHVAVGFGYGYPAYYRPYGYYGGFYPRSYVGFNVWPRYRTRRERQSEAREVRNQALYVYPAAGQSAQKLADDRYDCHVWSVDSTGFDPTLGAGSRNEADNYARAFTACMEGRDYVVR
jgi:hypothetical protein